MTFLQVATTVIAPIMLVVGAGALFSRRFSLDMPTLSSLSIYLLTPLLVLDGIANAVIQPDEFGRIALGVVLLTVTMTGIGLALSRLLGFDRRLESAFLLSTLLMNAANYGLPLNEFAYGPDGLARAMIFYVNSAIIVNTFGVFLASRGSASLRGAALNVLRVPLIYALLIGLGLNIAHIALPLTIQRAVSLLGGAAVPLMMVILGIQLTRARLRGRIGPIALATAAKLVLAPLVMAGLCLPLGITGLTRQVMIVQAGTPTAIMAGVLAAEFGADAEFTTSVTLVTTLGSLLTLNVLLTVLG